MDKQALFQTIDTFRQDMAAMADAIYDHPELGYHETFAAETLCSFLQDKGFAVERGVAGLDTAFRTEIKNLDGGVSVGLLAEYDALPGVHHACGHHMQGPVMIAAFLALAQHLPKDRPWTVVLYGTPAEEGGAGKVRMLEKGCFRDIDVALMMHGGDKTTYDPFMSANVSYTVSFSGRSAHAAAHPEDGRSAFDALLLTMTGIEFMREHMADHARIHYTAVHAGHTPANIVPESAEGSFMLRSLNDHYLDDMIRRFSNIVAGAAMMTETTYTMTPGPRLNACLPNQPLADLFYENAKLAGAPRIAPPRGTMGSTDFGNVMQIVPGICARVAFAPVGTGAHSPEWAAVGKSEDAHACVMAGAKIIAGMASDILFDGGLLERIRQDFAAEKAKGTL